MKKRKRSSHHLSSKRRSDIRKLQPLIQEVQQKFQDGLKKAEHRIGHLIQTGYFDADFGPGHALTLIALNAYRIAMDEEKCSFTEEMCTMAVWGACNFLQQGKWIPDPSFPFTSEEMLQAVEKAA